MELEKLPLRVFEFEDKILTVGKDFYQILNQDSFKIEVDQRIEEGTLNEKQLTILN